MSTINLNELRDRAYKIARDHGFHDADWSNEHLLSFVRKVDSVEYRDHHDFMEFLRNVAADIWVEYTEPEQRGRLFNLINKKK